LHTEGANITCDAISQVKGQGGPFLGFPMVANTIFHQQHLNLNAKMFNFGGWDMPIHYGSQISEHLHTRNSVSIFDVSHMAVVDVHGDDAHAFLENLLANNINKLESEGQALYSCMLNHEGGILDDLIAYKVGNFYRLVINASTAENDLVWMRAVARDYKLLEIIPRRSNIQGMQSPLVLLALQGPQSLLAISNVFPLLSDQVAAIPYFGSKILDTEFGEVMFSRTGYTGEDGFELFLPFSYGCQIWDLFLSHGVLPAGLGARDTLRIEAGYNLYGQDMSSGFNPFDCGLAWTVDLGNERHFIGSNSLRTYSRKFSFMGLVLMGKGILRAHQVIKTEYGDGEITSGTFSPSLQQSIAFARVPRQVVPNSLVNVVIRDQIIPAKVIKPTFVRKGKSLI
jgi:aminomethyltransferase